MTRKFLPTAAVLALVSLGLPTPAKADPVTEFIASYLVGKLVDEVWDSASGKPDVGLLDKRLKELENNAVMRGDMRREIRKLRQSVNDRVTRAEFRKMAEQASTEIGSIKQQVDDLEERVEKLEVENDDLRNGTKNATDAQFFVKRVERYWKEKNFDRAIANCNIAIRLDAKNVSAYQTRSDIYIDLGAPQAAILDATMAIRLDPKNARGHVSRGWAYVQLKEYAKAIDDLTKAIDLDGLCTTNAYYDRGLAYTRLQEYTKAIGDYTLAIDLNPKFAMSYAGRGDAYVQLKEYTKAIDDLTKAIDLDPKFSVSYADRGWARAQLKEYAKAIDDLTKAIEIDPKFADAYVSRASIYEARGSPGDREQAQKDRQKAESLR